MAVDPRRADTYLRQLMKMAEDSPDKLSPTERRISVKIRASQQKASGINSELSQLRDQITQGEARVRSLELQAKGEEGRIQGLLDFVVDEKFGEGDPMTDAGPMDAGAPPPDMVPPDAPPPSIKPPKKSKDKEVQPTA